MSDFIFHSAQRIREVEEIIGYEFKDKILLDRALQAAGFGLLREGNKPLALIGDATLKLIIRMMGYETNASIGRTTQLHDTWAANENLWQIGFAKRLDTFIHLNPSSRGVVQDRLMATTMEAILGAVYLDGQKDIAAVLRVVLYLGLTDDA
ncbi:uncharacterized protein N7473_000165 [Penicillium subrubescens]|uniref:RNase III domain-containing protein n=1 Tax=Penicillium subrubescens TaxID=1316194 RepID=A0A1Q5SNI6_9EURO|nr:uncharacterized protein N7473_000165 [Penicillium subrubescens]KAJ5910862.1 hypothetical protein N7473_000165 [Penicillium subrubescens]OKO89564.1 hypothetical protein PENSUB_13630 [Penicillium subrubescens]